jgi:two-component system sensor histidine kinase HydH
MSRRFLGLSPIKPALFLSVSYLVIALVWIHSSTSIAESFSSSLEDLVRFEIYKGFLFMIVSSIALFFFSWSLFRKMAVDSQQLIQSQQRLARAERQATAGLLAASVAHDFSNLLTILRLSTERLKTSAEMSEISKDAVLRLDHAVNRLADLAQRLRNAGHSVLRDKPKMYDLNEAIDETLDLLGAHQVIQQCEIIFEPASKIEIRGYPVLIHQLVMNLVLNAAEATEGHGKIWIRAHRDENATLIEVHDNGPGISPLLRDGVFDAFFTTKRHGTGLGLMSVKSCVEIHPGVVDIGDSPLGGALFTVVLADLPATQTPDVKPAETLNKKESHPPPTPLS